MDRYTFDFQVDDYKDGHREVGIVLKQPGSFACFTGVPQITRECRTADDLNEEIDRTISELEELRGLGHQALAKSN